MSDPVASVVQSDPLKARALPQNAPKTSVLNQSSLTVKTLSDPGVGSPGALQPPPFSVVKVTEGQQGKQGPPGQKGDKGDPGRGVQAVAVQDNGDVTVEYTDETTETVGHLVSTEWKQTDW